jgi:hypothetical protein
MQYDERELRFAFILAIVLFGFGCIAFGLGIPFQQPRWIVGGFVLAALGLALGVKLRQVIGNDRREDK